MSAACCMRCLLYVILCVCDAASCVMGVCAVVNVWRRCDDPSEGGKSDAIIFSLYSIQSMNKGGGQHVSLRAGNTELCRSPYSVFQQRGANKVEIVA